MFLKRSATKRPTLGDTLSAPRVSNNSQEGTSDPRQYFFIAVLRNVDTPSTSDGVACCSGARLFPSCFTKTAEGFPKVCETFSCLSKADKELHSTFHISFSMQTRGPSHWDDALWKTYFCSLARLNKVIYNRYSWTSICGFSCSKNESRYGDFQNYSSGRRKCCK